LFRSSFTLEDGHLVSEVIDSSGVKQGNHVLMAQSESTFFQKDFESEYEFVNKDKGKITSVLSSQLGQKTEARRKP
jgi:hypothetical protein